MKKIISLAIVLSLLIFSCSSDDVQDNSAPGLVLLRKRITTSMQGTVITNINYNGNKIVNSISSDGTEDKFYYTGDLITKYEIYENNILVHTQIYNYNSQNILTSGIELNHDTNQGNRTTLTYNSNGTITYNMYLGDLISQTGLFGTFTATLTNGEITTFKDELLNTTYTCIYDTKNNYMKNILGNEKVKMHIGSGTYRNLLGIFQNLIQQQTTTQTGSQYINRTIQYTYNSENLPLTSVMKSFSSSGALLTTFNTTYFYE
jgi:hypothetical protein